MCGINGGYNITSSQIASMVQATSHRGPDAVGIQSFGPVYFGHNRLSIIDVDARSNQPMSTPDGMHHLVFNGEIYNFQELKKTLPKWNFKTSGDTEVLLALLATEGISALAKLHGMFSFGWYDLEKDELYLVRDQMGVKPLYYTHVTSGIAFSSELNGMLAIQTSRNLNFDALGHYFSGNYVPSPLSMIETVRKLPAGHHLKFKNGQISLVRYYQPGIPEKKGLDITEIYKVTENTVTQQLVSDRPVGIFLSGGLDSSIVLHHAAKAGPVKTFTTSFEMVAGGESEYEKYNADAQIAKRTALVYGATHTDIPISINTIREQLIELVAKLDEPIANAITPTQLLLSQTVRQTGVVVALGGDGGDELWGGYDRHVAVLAAQKFQSMPLALQKAFASMHSKIANLRIPTGSPLHQKLTIFPESNFNQVLKIPLSNNPSKSLLEQKYQEERYKYLPAIDAFMRVDRSLWLADDALQRSDRTSMAVGLEVRVPLLGLPIVTLADSIFGEAKFSPWQTKALLRKAYLKHLPSYLFNQPKRGWMAPGAKWFRDKEIGNQIRSVFSSSFYDGLDKLVDWQKVQVLMDDHVSAKTYALNPLWNLFVLQIWAQKHKIKFESK